MPVQVPARYCSRCGSEFETSQLTVLAGEAVCAACKPAVLRQHQGAAAGEGAAPILASPPGLAWVWVLVLSALTLGLFEVIWEIVLSVFSRRQGGRPAPLNCYIAWFVLVFGSGFAVAAGGAAAMVSLLLRLAGVVVLLVGRFALRTDLERLYRLKLGGGMTFFFGGLYFQYHLNRVQQNSTLQLS